VSLLLPKTGAQTNRKRGAHKIECCTRSVRFEDSLKVYHNCELNRQEHDFQLSQKYLSRLLIHLTLL